MISRHRGVASTTRRCARRSPTPTSRHAGSGAPAAVPVRDVASLDVPARKEVVERSSEAPRRSGEAENDELVGRATLAVGRLVEEAGTVVAVGSGEATHTSGGVRRFAFCDVFTFAAERTYRVESYLAPRP